MEPGARLSAAGRSVVVVGAGVAGLAAASALASAGAHVTVLERRPYVGGRAYSYLHPALDEVVDSQHVLVGCCANLIDFCNTAGLAEKIRWYDRQIYLEPSTATRTTRASAIAPSALPAPLHYAASFLNLSMLGLALPAGAGCAHNDAPPVAPQHTLAALVEAPPPADEPGDALPDHDMAPAPVAVQHHVEITVDHLPAPKTFDAAATTYVFWVRANDDDAWSNAAHLEPSKNAEEAKFDFGKDVLFVHVTAEATPDARRPSEKVVLSTRVTSNGACAHSVDQNDVKMKGRMCR